MRQIKLMHTNRVIVSKTHLYKLSLDLNAQKIIEKCYKKTKIPFDGVNDHKNNTIPFLHFITKNQLNIHYIM